VANERETEGHGVVLKRIQRGRSEFRLWDVTYTIPGNRRWGEVGGEPSGIPRRRDDIRAICGISSVLYPASREGGPARRRPERAVLDRRREERSEQKKWERSGYSESLGHR
jgi:hypothetical protein